MRVLVVENEIYLAQSIAAKLEDAGFVCERAVTTKEALEYQDIDILLISSNFSDYYFHQLIDEYKNKITILMVSYINADTVTKPLNAGALDYVLKPFMIEELIRKIEHFWSFKRLAQENDSLKRYMKQSFDDLECDDLIISSKPPILIKTNYQRCADLAVYKYSIQKHSPIVFRSLLETIEIPQVTQDATLYLSNFEMLKKSEKQIVLEKVRKLPVIISTTNEEEELIGDSFAIKQISYKAQSFKDSGLLSIEEYVKFAILSNQDRYSDTELSKRLGISRKSLWEKRKKYGFFKN